MGSIVAKLYGNNLDVKLGDLNPTILKEMVAFEDDLQNWQRGLPDSLRLRPWENLEPGSWSLPEHGRTSARLSVVTHLRYLNVRILLHRPVLQRLLQGMQTDALGPANQDQTFFATLLRSSTTICQDTAARIVDIVSQLSLTRGLLGARWFSIYYSESTSVRYCLEQLL